MEAIDQSGAFRDRNQGEGRGEIIKGPPWLRNAKQHGEIAIECLRLLLSAKPVKIDHFSFEPWEKLDNFLALSKAPSASQRA